VSALRTAIGSGDITDLPTGIARLLDEQYGLRPMLKERAS
jgi:hypothetical protein